MCIYESEFSVYTNVEFGFKANKLMVRTTLVVNLNAKIKRVTMYVYVDLTFSVYSFFTRGFRQHVKYQIFQRDFRIHILFSKTREINRSVSAIAI